MLSAMAAAASRREWTREEGVNDRIRMVRSKPQV
jgi:hypothetical protein